MSTRTVLLSIHDVNPETLEQVQQIAALVADSGMPAPILLVTPGKKWTPDALLQLHRLCAVGHPLAAHGWSHEVQRVTGVRHRFYSAVVSRQSAEHLDCGRDVLVDRLCASYAWFGEHGFAPPQLYVPPAWALGDLPQRILRNLPFRWYETLTGIYDSKTDCWHRLPVVGFEADSPARALSLRLSNWANHILARSLGRPIRVAIHPNDLGLRLADQLRMTLQPNALCAHVNDLPLLRARA